MCENISSFFLNFVSGELPFFVLLRFFPFLLFFILDFLCLYLVNLPFCSLRCSSCFSLSVYSFTFFFHLFFITFLLSSCRLFFWLDFFHGLPFFGPLEKNCPLSFSLSSFSVFLHLLVPNCLFFVSSFHLYLFFLFSPFFSPFSFIFSFLSWDPWS